MRLTNVSKRYRRRHLIQEHHTLKSLFLRRKSPPLPERARYNRVFEGLNLAIKEGTTTGIIGENGSGKSTLLKLIAGILRPDAGEIIVNGRVSALIELGAGFHPDFSGRENIFINGIILGLSKKEMRRRFDDIVRFSELGEFIDEPVRTYSSGMFMRLGFSVAVNVDPDILLIDEVLSVGDESFAHKCEAKIEEFKGAKKTILLVSHDLGAVERWCDEAVWIDRGMIMERGLPRKVIDAYRQETSRREGERMLKEKQEAPVVEGPAQEEAPVQEDRKRGSRWGSGEVEITSVRLLDESGSERYLYNLGEPLTIEMRYRVRKEVERPVLGIGIIRGDGVHCYGSNTLIDKVDVPRLNGEGIVLAEIESLDLIEGTYYLDVAVHSEDGHDYDYRTSVHSFAVRSPIKDIGIYRPRHRWVIR